jgi:hypothetical protein
VLSNSLIEWIRKSSLEIKLAFLPLSKPLRRGNGEAVVDDNAENWLAG